MTFPGRLNARYYEPERWLEDNWCAEWIRALPKQYWVQTIDALCEHWFIWLDQKDIAAFLDTEEGRRVITDQLFLRVSQASETFVPWVTAKCTLQGKRVMEIGGGAGSSTAALVRAGADVTAVDISAGYLEIARVRLRAMGYSCRQILAKDDWLSADYNVATIFEEVGKVDLIVCYALFEHLLIDERLRLLGQIRDAMRVNPDLKLVIWETPNRFAPFDWHTTRVAFPDVVPDKLAALYIEAVISPEHNWVSQGFPWNGGSIGDVQWARAGRGMSFHEFEVALGSGSYEVIQDGYWGAEDHQAYYRPNLAYERALAEIFGSMNPPIHRGFCRPSLNLILQHRAETQKIQIVRSNVEVEGPEPETVFREFYEKGWWGSGESKSGRGSEIETTLIFRNELEKWLAAHLDVNSILDAPCGDFNWMRALKWPRKIEYIGADIVPDLVTELIERYEEPGRRFLHLDIAVDEIPDVDLWLCRDALFHFPFEMGKKVIEQFTSSKIKYFMSTTFPTVVNDADCKLGGYHHVNLETAPFNLGPPLSLLRDPGENNQGHRFVGVWKNRR